MRKRYLTLAVALTIVLFSFSVGVCGEDENSDIVAYVPLDNRPVNTDRVEYLLGSIGYKLVMPSEDLYATKLDGQPLNSNGTQYGDCQALCDWLLKMEGDGCDNYIISLDQVFSGGLVNSRAAVFPDLPEDWEPQDPSDPINPPDPNDPLEPGTGEQGEDSQDEEGEVTDPTPTWQDIVNAAPEMGYIEETLAVLAQDQNNEIVFFDTVMRLASTVGYQGYGQDMYDALREYGKVDRYSLTGEDLTVENIIAGYKVDSKGKPCEEVLTGDSNGAKKKLLTANNNEAIDKYLASRARKLCLIDAVVDKVGLSENIYYLVGVDDSSPGNSVQTNEIAYISEKLGERGMVFDGADELGMMAVTRLYTKSQDKTVSLQLKYFGDMDDASGYFETQDLSEVITKHVAGIGAKEVVNAETADIQVLVLTPPKHASLRYFYAKDLVETYNENLENKIPTIIIDASDRTYYGAFNQRLIEESDVGYLLGYSSWNTWGNATGIALSQGICRYLYLASSGEKDIGTHQSFVRSLTFGLVKDMAYVYKGRTAMSDYIENKGLSSTNFYRKNLNFNMINRHLAKQIETASDSILTNLNSSNIIVDLKDYQEMGINNVDLSDFEFPWFRTFECRFSISLESLTDPYKKDDVDPEPEPEYVTHTPYINGYDDGTFRPGDEVARCELTKMVAVAENLSLDGKRLDFPDVPGTAWYYSYVESVAGQGYLMGYEDGTFRPENSMTRAEFASFLTKFAHIHGLEAKGEHKYFTDVDSSSWYYQSVTEATTLGLVKGYDDGTFRPQAAVTRGEAVTMLNRALGRNLKSEGVGENLILAKNPFSDISLEYWGCLDVLEAAVEHKYLKTID